MYRVCFLLLLATAYAHSGDLVPSCNHGADGVATPLQGLPGSRSGFNEGNLSPSFGFKGQPFIQQKLVQEPIIQEPVVQEPIIQEPVQQTFVQEPLVQQKLVQEPVEEPIIQQQIVPKEVYPVKGVEPVIQEPVRVWSTEAPIIQQQFVQEPVHEPVVQQQTQSELGLESHLVPTFSQPMSQGAQRLGLPNGADNVLVGGIVSTFSCWGRAYGYFADVANNCQIFHVCQAVLNNVGVYEMSRSSFFCPDGTIFDQIRHICDAPSEALPCNEAIRYYPHTEQRFAPPPMAYRPPNTNTGFGTYSLPSTRSTTFATKGGSRAFVPLPMMTETSKTTVRSDFGIKGTQPITRSYPVKTIPSPPITQEVRTEFVPETFPVKGREIIPTTTTTVAPVVYPVKGLPVKGTIIGNTRTMAPIGQTLPVHNTQPSTNLQFGSIPLSPSRALNLQKN